MNGMYMDELNRKVCGEMDRGGEAAVAGSFVGFHGISTIISSCFPTTLLLSNIYSCHLHGFQKV